MNLPVASLPPELARLIDALAEEAPPPTSIWLFGSQANGCARPDSDWDLLIHANQAYFDRLQAIPAPSEINVDVLIVIDGTAFKNPWNSKKAGNLATWKWRKTGAGTAEYESTKWVSDPDSDDPNIGDLDTKINKAFQVWPII